MLVRAVEHFLLVFLTLIYKVSCQGASLTFVIDDTRSMGDDIAQVRSSVDSLMDIVLNEKSSLIDNIVLVTFNDPAVRVRNITKSRNELKAALSKVKVNNYFNYDCPEMALSGVKLALESSLPGSFIYVFTDASAKDYKMSEEIKQLCQEKQSQIVFVLTGDCRKPQSKKFQVYYDIATASSGLAFKVGKPEVTDVIHTIAETIKGNKTLLTSIVTPPHEYTDVPFQIDDLTEYVIVSASGIDVTLEILEPSNRHAPKKKIMWTRNGKVVKILDPYPGRYVARVRGATATSVVVTGRSDFLFHHGFSEQEPKSFDDTTPQPFSDTLTQLSISVKDPQHSVQIKSAQILDMKENVIKTVSLKELSPNFYTTEQFVAPDYMFKVAVIGEAKQTDESVRRIAKIPVTPAKPPVDKLLAKAPVVEIKEGGSYEVPRGGPVTLTCTVSAFPKPEITWTNDKGITLKSTSTRKDLRYDYISYLKIAKVTEGAKYHCHAKNVLNDDKKTIDVVTKDPITINTVPKATTKIAYGTSATINCDVTSQLPIKITWHHVNKLTGKTENVISSAKYTLSSDGKQLKVLSMDVELVGKYTCKAFVRDDPKEKQELSTNVEIYGLVAPKIEPVTESVTVVEHMPATIKCKILKAVPKPTFSWQFKASGSASSSYQAIAGSGAELYIASAVLQDAGTYRCVATNVEGSDERTVAELVVDKAPVVTIEQGPDTTVQYGSQLTLTCKVTAHPPPAITWTDDRGNALPASVSGSRHEFEYTYKITKMKESGKYVCRAENKQGSKAESIQVNVLPAFRVQSHPTDIIDVLYGTSTDLICDIKSPVPMKIEWYYASDSKNTSRRLLSSGKTYQISSDSRKLKINSMDVDLKGAYTCRASLIDDPDVTEHFTTIVDIGGLVQPEINPLLVTMEINENNPAIISCKILKGVPVPDISWQVKAAGSSEYRSIAGSGSELRIEKAALANGGHYKCIAKNVAGHREQVVAELMVLKAPAVTIVEGASMNVPYGSRLTLTCRVTANPRPTVTWKDSAGKTHPAPRSAVKSVNKLVSVKSTKSGFKYTYTITHVNVKASGKYSCSASNRKGEATESIQVSVSSPFNIGSHLPDSTSGKYGTKVNLKCDITSKFPMKIRWYHTKDSASNEQEIESSNKYTILSNGAELNINSLDIGLDGKYACKASLLEDPNQHLEYTTQVHIDGLEVPKIIGDDNRKVTVGASVSIKCNVVKGVPKPELSWQFRHTDAGEYSNIDNTGNEWYITNVTLEHSGFYTCTAKNNQGISTHTVELTVQEPARITSEEYTVYEGIIGDIALRIPCEAVGFPKPTIEWKVDGSVVTPGTKYVIEDGALVIKYPERSDSNYTCTATNDAGSDSKTFRGVVDDTFTDYGTLHEVNILKGDSKNLTCTLPRSDSSSVKWFIEPQNITHVGMPYVIVKDAKLDDDGNYTCHISDIHGSATETFSVDVGYPPTFKPSPQGSVVEWSGDTEDLLNCKVRAKPEANVEWTFNGEPLVGPMELNIFKWGHYKCNVSNVHGAVQKEFEVKPTACLIRRKTKETSHMPLMLTEELTWPDFQTSGEYMIMKPGDKLMLSCYNHEKSPNSFRKFPALGELEVSCIKGDIFTVDGEPYQLQDLQCTNEIYPSVVKTNSTCLIETAEVIKVGYNIGQFVEAYEVCFDYAKNIPLYTRVLMSETNNIPNAVNEWFEYPGIGNGRAEAYTCKNSSSSCCYAKTQLASATDFSYGPVQNSSFIYPLNAIPNWRPCDSDRSTWENVENIVRARLDVNPNIVVWSGVNTLHEEKNGAVIPRYLWKVVRESEDEAIAIVYVNVAAPTADDIKCNNICAGGDGTWYSTGDKYTYCCTVDDFLEAFNIPGDVVGESLDQYDQTIDDKDMPTKI